MKNLSVCLLCKSEHFFSHVQIKTDYLSIIFSLVLFLRKKRLLIDTLFSIKSKCLTNATDKVDEAIE